MKIIIFGIQQMAQLAHYYINNDTDHQVEAFVVNQKFKNIDRYCGLPVVDFENIQNLYPPDSYRLFAPIYAQNMNRFRKEVYDKGKELGYSFFSYISSKALTWNSKIGENCFIFEGCNLQPFSSVGDNVIIWSFSHLGHHSSINNNVFVSSNVVIAGNCVIKDYCFLGTNSTIKDKVTINEGTFIGMDASVIRDTDEWSVYVGIPAQKLNKSSLEVKL